MMALLRRMMLIVAMLVAAATVTAGVARAEPPAETPAAEPPAGDGAKGEKWGDPDFKKSYRQSQPPAKGDAYRYRQIAFGALIVAAMGALLIWLIRRSKRTS